MFFHHTNQTWTSTSGRQMIGSKLHGSGWSGPKADHLCSMEGADLARPLSDEIPILSIWRIMISLGTCLVSMSAGFSVPGTFVSLKSPRRTRSCTHKSAVARWRIFPNPRRRQMPMAAVASVRTSSSTGIPRSMAKDCKPRPMDAPRHMPPSSASPELSATVV